MKVLAFGSQSPSKTLHPNSEVGDDQDCFPIQLELNQDVLPFFEQFFANLFLCTNFTNNVFYKTIFIDNIDVLI